jgi:hypothetical protein
VSVYSAKAVGAPKCYPVRETWQKGPTFIPDRISLTYPQAEQFSLPADEIGCRLSFEEQTNQVVFRSAWLEPRQQDDISGGRRPLRRAAQRAEIASRGGGRDSGSPDPGYRQSSDPCGDSKGPRRERSLVAASATGARRFLSGLAGRTSNAPCDQISAHDKASERGYCAGARLQRFREFPPRISPLDQQVAQRAQT